ncbi:PREDICTED: uncharacterized protein LOC108556532 [Nicrophorus vespilloides]|uniref:Uncharacterized protein LOC108556532 n=1 Tax=Nicrophorus vespilloides TaxID=110193 RepID=A0ABM1M0S2_NICVS|nr:PREDICTED: uncharacterized protein LOC108556532 [Nicrophorus vespilloides]
MISIKLTLLIFTILASKGLSEEGDGIFDQITEAIEKLKSLIQNAINKALQALNDMFLKLLKLPFELLEQAIEKLIEMIDKAKQDIAKLLEKAEEMGVDASECVKSSDSSLIVTMTETIAQLTVCVTDKLCEAKDMMKKTISDIKRYIETIDEIQMKIAECGSGLGAVKCLTGVLAEIIKLSTSLPLEIAKQVKQITELMKTVQTAMINCEVQAIFKATAEIGAMVFEVGKCVSEKVKESETLI